MPADEPRLSIVVATVQGWSDIRANVETWEVASAAADGELIVVDGSALPGPPDGALTARTSWVSMPGASVFQGREAGYRRARAPIVAITEDHCRVPTEWATRFLAAMEAAPDAVAVGGSVENGATTTSLDWASYFIVQGPLIPPIASGRVSRLAGAVNVAYRRDALEGLDDFDGLGAMDHLHQQRLRRGGAVLVADDSIRVVHDQSLSPRAMAAIHYHAGRTFAGFLRARMTPRAWLRFAAVPVLPWIRLARALRLAGSRGYSPTLRRTWPAMLFLLYCQAAGHLAGFVAGAGDSPRHVQ